MQYPNQDEIKKIYEERDRKVAALREAGIVTAKDLQMLCRQARCLVANNLWSICTEEARQAMLHDGHHFVRSCAAISMADEANGDCSSLAS